jgi:hypothetical protein
MSERRLNSLNGENIVYETGKDSSLLVSRERKRERAREKEEERRREKESPRKGRRQAQ